MDRISKKMLEAVLARVAMDHGSKVYGRVWRVYHDGSEIARACMKRKERQEVGR